jgi:CRISPR/Cas system-associated endonuclease Cas1
LRGSLLTSSPRLAINPANAILNYLYAILEAETRLACLTLGLDPASASSTPITATATPSPST